MQDAAEYAGARKPVRIIEEPMAAAIGSGLPVQEPTGSMIVDIGGGTTEVAVISLGGVVTSQSVRVGGDELDEAIIQYIKKEYSLALGERTAELVKMELGSACAARSGAPGRGPGSRPGDRSAEDDRHLHPRDPRGDRRAGDHRDRRGEGHARRTPPELAADIMERGIMLAGGGALLKGLPERLAAETGMPICIAARPLDAVALGSGQILEEFDALEGLLPSSERG